MKRGAEFDFSPATLIQVLRHRIRGTLMILMTQGWWGVQNVGKPDDVILERSLMVKIQNMTVYVGTLNSEGTELLQSEK